MLFNVDTVQTLPCYAEILKDSEKLKSVIVKINEI